MRQFIYYSKNAVTSGSKIKDDLMKAGRLDIACQIVIQSFFVSHHMRPDVKLHLIFDGPPTPPRHLEMFPGNISLGDIKNKIDISKKDVAGLIKKMLYKYKEGKKAEVGAGFHIEKKSFSQLINDLVQEGKEVFILDRRGEDLRETKIPPNSAFVIGDQDGIPKSEIKKIKHLKLRKISVSPYMLFASQTMTILHNELDRREVQQTSS